MKLTKTQTKNLTAIWTTKIAADTTDRIRTYRLTKAQAAEAGYGWMNANASQSLISKGLATTLVTKDEYAITRVRVLILTPAGRAALGV